MMKTIFNRTWELSLNYSIAHTGIEVMKNRLIKTAMQKKEIDQNIEFVVNKKANNRSNVSDTEEETKKPFILKVQYGKHFHTLLNILITNPTLD